MSKKPELLYRGRNFTVYLDTTKGERSDIVEYLALLLKKDEKLHARLMTIIKRFANGTPAKDSIETIKGEGLIRIKVPGQQIRLLGAYLAGKRVVVLHGFDKKDPAIKKRHLDQAQNNYSQFRVNFKNWIKKLKQ